MAEDCLRPQFTEGLLWKQQTLKLSESAAKTDPKLTLAIQTIVTGIIEVCARLCSGSDALIDNEQIASQFERN